MLKIAINILYNAWTIFATPIGWLWVLLSAAVDVTLYVAWNIDTPPFLALFLFTLLGSKFVIVAKMLGVEEHLDYETNLFQLVSNNREDVVGCHPQARIFTIDKVRSWTKYKIHVKYTDGENVSRAVYDYETFNEKFENYIPNGNELHADLIYQIKSFIFSVNYAELVKCFDMNRQLVINVRSAGGCNYKRKLVTPVNKNTHSHEFIVQDEHGKQYDLIFCNYIKIIDGDILLDKIK